MSLIVKLDDKYKDSHVPTSMVLTAKDDGSIYHCRTPGLEPSSNYVETMLTLYRALRCFNSVFRAKLDLKLEFPKPDLSHNDPNSALLLSEIELLSDTYFQVYDGRPKKPSEFYKERLDKLLLSFKNQFEADFQGAYIPYVVNKTEKLLGTELFVRLLEIATDEKSKDQRRAIGLINKIFYSYKHEMKLNIGRAEGEQKVAEELTVDKFYALPSGGISNWSRELKT